MAAAVAADATAASATAAALAAGGAAALAHAAADAAALEATAAGLSATAAGMAAEAAQNTANAASTKADSAQAKADSCLPLTGGTLTGQLEVASGGANSIKIANPSNRAELKLIGTNANWSVFNQGGNFSINQTSSTDNPGTLGAPALMITPQSNWVQVNKLREGLDLIEDKYMQRATLLGTTSTNSNDFAIGKVLRLKQGKIVLYRGAQDADEFDNSELANTTLFDTTAIGRYSGKIDPSAMPEDIATLSNTANSALQPTLLFGSTSTTSNDYAIGKALRFNQGKIVLYRGEQGDVALDNSELANTTLFDIATIGRHAGKLSPGCLPEDLIWTSNAAGLGPFGSNTSVWASNAAVFASNLAPAVEFSSNGVVYSSNSAVYSSNAAVFASNLAPAVEYSSNCSAWSSNAASFASNLSPSASFSSNAAVSACNTAVWSSNQLPLYRKEADQVPWDDISGAPTINDNTSLAIGGMAMGAAGLMFGATQLFNNSGQLTGAIANAADTVSIGSTGAARLDNGLNVGGSVSLDPTGLLHALKIHAADQLKVGLLSLTLKDDAIHWTSNTQSNLVMASNALTVHSAGPFTFSNGPWVFTGATTASNFACCNLQIAGQNPTDTFAPMATSGTANSALAVASWSSNQVAPISAQATSACNLAVTASNAAYPAAVTADWSSNALASSSNAVWPKLNWTSNNMPVGTGVGWASGGAGVVYTNSNIGIGTSTATDKLVVAGNVTTNGLTTTNDLCVAGTGKLYLNSSNYGFFTENWGWTWKPAVYDGKHHFKIVDCTVSIGRDITNTTPTQSLVISGNNAIEVGYGYPNKEANAGKIGYCQFSTVVNSALDIVGAGVTGSSRTVKIWDKLLTSYIGDSGNSLNITFKNDGSGLKWGDGYSKIYDDGNLKVDTDDFMYWYISGNEKMFLSSAKWTTQGYAEINGKKNMSVNTFGYLNASGGTGYYNGNTAADYSLDCPYGRIRCTEFNANSDAREKTSIEGLPNQLCLDVLTKLSPKGYVKTTEGLYKWGFIAQEVETVLPQAVTQVPHKEWQDYRVLDYNQVFTCSVGAIKALHERIQALENSVAALQTTA